MSEEDFKKKKENKMLSSNNEKSLIQKIVPETKVGVVEHTTINRKKADKQPLHSESSNYKNLNSNSRHSVRFKKSSDKNENSYTVRKLRAESDTKNKRREVKKENNPNLNKASKDIKVDSQAKKTNNSKPLTPRRASTGSSTRKNQGSSSQKVIPPKLNKRPVLEGTSYKRSKEESLTTYNESPIAPNSASTSVKNRSKQLDSRIIEEKRKRLKTGTDVVRSNNLQKLTKSKRFDTDISLKEDKPISAYRSKYPDQYRAGDISVKPSIGVSAKELREDTSVNEYIGGSFNTIKAYPSILSFRIQMCIAFIVTILSLVTSVYIGKNTSLSIVVVALLPLLVSMFWGMYFIYKVRDSFLELGDKSVKITKGLFSVKKEIEAPYDGMLFVQVEQNLTDRVFNTGTIKVGRHSGEKFELTFPNLKNPNLYAKLIKARLKEM